MRPHPPNSTDTENDTKPSQAPGINWSVVMLITLTSGALSMVFIVMNNNFLNWPIHESMWCVIAMGLASGYFILNGLIKAKPNRKT